MKKNMKNKVANIYIHAGKNDKIGGFCVSRCV